MINPMFGSFLCFIRQSLSEKAVNCRVSFGVSSDVSALQAVSERDTLSNKGDSSAAIVGATEIALSTSVAALLPDKGTSRQLRRLSSRSLVPIIVAAILER